MITVDQHTVLNLVKTFFSSPSIPEKSLLVCIWWPEIKDLFERLLQL